MSRINEDADLAKCRACEFYDKEDDVCTAFECFNLGFLDGCPPLPCEVEK